MSKIISFVFNDFTNDLRVLKENISLKNAGFKMTVVATLESGLKKLEFVKDLEVHRIKVNYIKALPIQLFFYWIKCIVKYRKEAIFHCNDLYALPIGVFIKIFFNKKAKVVYDCHEYETEAHIYDGRKWLKIAAKISERLLIRYCDEVITVSESIANEYQRLYKIKKPTLVLNCPRFQKYEKKDLFRQKFGIKPETKIVLFQGEYRKGRGLEIMIEAFKKLNDKNLALVFLGYGALTNFVKQETMSSSNIYVHETVSLDVYMDYICSADFGIHIMENTCLNHYYALPNKLFEYIMAGLPVIVSNLYEMKRFVEKYNVGIVLHENNVASLLEVLNKINSLDLTIVRENTQKVAQVYNWGNQEITLINLYKNLVQK